MAESTERGREAAADGQAGRRGDAEGGGIPEAAGGTTAAPVGPALETRKETGRPETGPNPAGFGSETGNSGGEASRSLPDAREEAAAGAGTGTRKTPLRRLLGRLRGSVFPDRPQDSPESAFPANVRPWTGEILPHVRETRDDGPLVHIMDRIAWATTLPDARHVLHAERLRRRRESLATRALVRFAATLLGKRSGQPPWLAEGRQRGNP